MSNLFSVTNINIGYKIVLHTIAGHLHFVGLLNFWTTLNKLVPTLNYHSLLQLFKMAANYYTFVTYFNGWPY